MSGATLAAAMGRVRRAAGLASTFAIVLSCGGISESRGAAGGQGMAGTGGAGVPGAGEPFELRVSAEDRGWWRADGFHESENDNMLTGFCGGCREAMLMNSYLTFPISDFAGAVEGVELELEQVDFGSEDVDEAFSIFDVRTDPGELEQSGQGQRGVEIFGDLESGFEFGRILTSPATSGTVLVTPLGSAIQSAVQAARGGKLALGLHLATYSGTRPNYEYVHFALDSEARHHTLVIAARR